MKNSLVYLVPFLLTLSVPSICSAQSEEKDVMVSMRDGIKLATDIYFPPNFDKAKQKLPVILHRTPYNKASVGYVKDAGFFCKNGYIVIFQDCRGRFNSGGIFGKYINEPEDSYDAVEWVAKQPWCNGKVGMRGRSYLAHVQADAAKLNPPHLATIVCNVGGLSNGWTHSVRNHGAFALKQVTWAFSNMASESSDTVIKQLFAREKVADWFQALPFKKGNNPLSVSPDFENYILEMWTHGDYDSYWKQMGINWVEYYGQTADIPMMHVSGWYDNYIQTATDNYTGLSKIKKSPIKLMIGPWMHGTMEQSFSGDVDFGEVSTMKDFYLQWHLDWYDHFLKGKDNRIGSWPNVKLFVMGTGDGHKDKNGRLFHGGYWLDASDWPLKETRYVNYYFHEDNSLSDKAPSPNEKSITYTFDPEHPVPTIGSASASLEPLASAGAFDQREKEYTGDPLKGFYGSKPPYLPLKARKDVLVYQTPVLEKNVTIIGPVKVVLHASSDCLDTDFTAKLVDVYPPSNDYPSGYEMNITDGIVRARYRNSPAKQEFMEQGKIYEITVEPNSTANVFKKGHRIRVDISSSNFPQYDVNPNTGEPLGKNNRTMKANNTIFHNSTSPSYIILPMIEK